MIPKRVELTFNVGDTLTTKTLTDIAEEINSHSFVASGPEKITSFYWNRRESTVQVELNDS